MQSEQQQRIMGYFIEEAKDHLNTIEQGLLSLQSTMADTEMVNEVFRAAHSVKGGAAMLGINSIQKTAHRLEDCFKVLKESPVRVDHQLESLFLRVFDTLEALVEQLQGPFGLTEETANDIMLDAEPVFEELNTHLGHLVKTGGSSTVAIAEAPLAPRHTVTSMATRKKAQPSVKNTKALPATFKRDVLVELREMLELFKQPDLPEHREALQEHCDRLMSLGEQADLPGWGELLETSKSAIAHSPNSYRLLASLVIKEIKQAQELVLANRSVEIAPSEQLKALVPEYSAFESVTESDAYEKEIALEPDTDFKTESTNSQTGFTHVSSTTNWYNGPDTYIQEDIREEFNEQDFTQEDLAAISSYQTHTQQLHVRENTASSPANPSDPEVGMAELNSLADIFEGQTPDLDQTWQEEEIISLDDIQFANDPEHLFSLQDQSDFSDLLGDIDSFEISATGASTGDDLGWWGNDSTEEVAIHSQESTPSLFSDREALQGSPEPQPKTTPSITNDDFSDLLVDADSPDSLADQNTSAYDLNNLFGDSFFEENSSLTDNTADLVLDTDAVVELQQQDDDLFAMPAADALNEADDLGLDEITSHSSTFSSSPDTSDSSANNEDFLIETFIGDEEDSLVFEDSFTSELEDFNSDEIQFDEAALTDSEFDFDDLLEISDSEPGESLLTSEEIDLSLDDSFWDISNAVTSDTENSADFGLEDFLSTDELNVSNNEAFTPEETSPTETPGTSALSSSQETLEHWETTNNENLIPRSAPSTQQGLRPAALTELSRQSENTDVSALDIEGDAPDTAAAAPMEEIETESEALSAWDLSSPFEETAVEDSLWDVEEPELALDESDLAEITNTWDLSNPFEETVVEESLWGVEEPELALDETDSEGMDAPTIDFDLDAKSTSPFNFDEESDGDMEDLFENTAFSSVEESQNAAFNSLEDVDDDLLGSQTTDAQALAVEGIDLPSLDESEAIPGLDNFFDAESGATDTSARDSVPEFEEFSLFESSTTTDKSDPTALESSQASELEALWGEQTLEDTDALDLLAVEPDALNFEQELFGTEVSSQEWSFDLEEEATVDPEAAMDWDAAEFPQAAEPTALESSQASELEALWGEQTLEDTDALDLLAVEPDALNFEQELFGTEASSQEWSFSSEEEATLDPEAAMDWDAAEFPQAAEPTALESSQASELEALWGEQTLEDTDAVEVPEEDLFETEMASDWDLESAEEAAEDSLDWEGAGAVEVGDLDDFLGSELDDFTEAQDSSWEGLDDLLEEGVEERNVVEDDFSFLTAQEADQTQVDEFDDLEAMLAEETTFLAGELDSFESDRGSVGEQSSADLEDLALGSLGASARSSSRLESEFDDLEAMLAEEGFEASAAFESADMDGFDDLEALLGEQTPASAEQSPASAKRKARATDALDDEFGDLEILLEQADKTMVGPPMAAPDQRQTRPSIRARPRVFEQTMRVPVKHLDSLSNLVGELVVNRNSLEQDQERLRQFLDNLSHQVLALSDVGARMQDLYERSLLESSLLASRQSYRSSFHAAASSHNNSNSSGVEYDPLEMDRFTGFHLLSQEMIELIVRVRESASDIEFLVDETDQVARMLRQVTTQLQEGLTRSRMVPFAQNADRLLRAVHEISRKLGKEAQLHVDGRETLIDKMILEHLYDPMTHLVNNALTHGIEMPEVRRAAGKPIAGQVTLRAFLQGNQTVISISDDGAGINPEKIRSKVIEKRLITPAEAKTLSRLDLYDFLFHPGFTTKDKADDFSGRGVGMDVVRTSLSEIRGTIHIDSTIGKGTTFTIRLPLTLSICKALCCLSERARMAFPMDGVEDMLDLSPDRIQTNSEGQTCIQWRDTLLPFQSLSELLKYNRQVSRGSVYGGKREDNLISIVVLRSAGNFIAIQVDQVLGEQEIVIKQLEGPAPKPVGIAGATVLGDGRIMPIADVLELIDLAMGRIRKDGGVTIWSRENPQDPESQEIPEAKSEPMVLIVDDSITVRELLSMTFNKAGYRVEQARDGQEAWDKLRSGLPCDIVFCDIEMPRMDGLELLSRLQKEENLRKLPIAMLTSRGADRHRQMASQLGASGYFTKPYLEEVLLEAAQRMIKGEVLFGSSSNA